MLESERRHLILSLLRQYQFLTIHDLAARLHASLATVRRDLTKLADEKLIVRVRGGAQLASQTAALPGSAPAEVPFDRRKEMQLERKRRIAQKAVSMCRDGQTIIIDGGTTTYHMAEFLLPRRLDILTNSFAIAELLVGKSPSRVVVARGEVFGDSKLILDPFESDVFRDYSASIVFMGVNGIGPHGLTNTDSALIRIERAMIERADKLVILADSSKFNRGGNLVLCGFDRVHAIITDAEVSEEAREMVTGAGVELVTV